MSKFRPALASFYSASHAIIAFAQGHSGLKASFDPLALLIVGHATYIILWSASAGRQQLSFRQSFRAALATMIVVWFAYYANRPQAVNLWTFVYLYSFIAMDLFCFLHHRLGPWRRLGPSVVFACVVMGTIVIPHLVYYNRLPFKTMSSEIGRIGTDPVASGAVRTSGVYLSKEVADELARKASFLREKNSQAQSGASGPLYLSASSYLISTLSGVYSPLPVVDGFTTIFTQRDYQALVDAIVTANRKEIYFDAADNIVAGNENYRRYFRKLQEDLAPFYEVSRAEMGWQVLQRRNGTSVQGHVPSGGRRASD